MGIVQRYPVRTTHRRNLEPKVLEGIARASFDSGEQDGGAVVVRFGAILELRARREGRELEIDIRMDPKVDVEVAAETVRRYNRFLESTTGYSSKERAKRLRKSAGSEG